MTVPVLRALVVDDEVLVAMYLSDVIEDAGWVVMGPAASPDEALEIIERELPDLVFMDLNVCDRMDGLPLAKELSERFGLPVVVVSGYPGIANDDRVIALKPLEILEKPFSAERVTEVLRSFGSKF